MTGARRSRPDDNWADLQDCPECTGETVPLGPKYLRCLACGHEFARTSQAAAQPRRKHR